MCDEQIDGWKERKKKEGEGEGGERKGEREEDSHRLISKHLKEAIGYC